MIALRVTTATPSGAQTATLAVPVTRIQPSPEMTRSVLSLMVNTCWTSFGKSSFSLLFGGVRRVPRCLS